MNWERYFRLIKEAGLADRPWNWILGMDPSLRGTVFHDELCQWIYFIEFKGRMDTDGKVFSGYL